ncbi:MAG: alpha/beta hydrolase [Azoarcus sp.]|nr:alpha/beta hydrolase [Azoarcus sp.]
MQSARVVLPPHDVIPIIFVPGVAGSNLKTKKEKTWMVPNGAGDIGIILKTGGRGQKKRQKLFDPLTSEVDPDGKCVIDDNVYWLTSEEAHRRGWGTIHAGSYHAFLQRLERVLNDITAAPGEPDLKKNYLLPEIGFLQYLNGGLPSHLTSSSSAKPSPRDYGLKAEEAMNMWGKKPPALTEKEIHKLGSYYYPVWVYGYNWLQDNEDSARGLLKFIDEQVLACYKRSQYFKCADKVIIVTHSMGGLVARRASQMLKERGQEDKILGVAHGVQPVMGAPALYRRLRAGQEAGDPAAGFLNRDAFMAGITSAVMGWSEQSMTVQLARAPGPLELAPTKDYPMNWLVVKGYGRKVFSLPEKDPYAEIYSKTTDDCWWGMVNPEYIDPAGTIREEGRNPAKEYKKAIGFAQAFHDKLKLYAHPETYGFYGIDDDKYRSFGYVEWTINVESPSFIRNVEAVKNAKGIEYKSAKVTVPLQYQERPLHLLHNPPREKPLIANCTATLSNARNQRGDGTVPEDSGKVLERLGEKPPVEVFTIPGFGHQDAFNAESGSLAGIYFIARIVQKAPPPTPRGKTPLC